MVIQKFILAGALSGLIYTTTAVASQSLSVSQYVVDSASIDGVDTAQYGSSAFKFPVDADVLSQSHLYSPEYRNRYFMSVFGPRYKLVSGSSIEYFDFHRGADINADVSFNGVTHSSTNPPTINSMCTGYVDEVQPDDTGDSGRWVRVKCDDIFTQENWGHIYLAYRHLEDIDVVDGQWIGAGQQIGLMGKTGSTNTVHLHLSVRRIVEGDFVNVHPMRVFDATTMPHLVTTLTDADIQLLEYDVTSALFRIIVPYNQANIRRIKLSLADDSWSRTYDYENVSLDAGDDERDLHNFIEGLELFAYPFNRGHGSYRRYIDKHEEIPAAYPASLLNSPQDQWPIYADLTTQSPAYIVDVRGVGLPAGYLINDLQIEIEDIWGHGLRAYGEDLTQQPNSRELLLVKPDNDAEQNSREEVTITSEDLDMATYKGITGLQFRDKLPPSGATIREAWIQFSADEDRTDESSLVISLEDSFVPEVFTEQDNDLGQRSVMDTQVTWNVQPWAIVDDMLAIQRTPDLSHMIQQQVSSAGWDNTESALSFLISGSGRRTADSANNHYLHKSPYLYLKYDIEVQALDNTPPIVEWIGPLEGAVLTGLGQHEASVHVFDADDNLDSVALYVNGELYASKSEAPWNFSWTTEQYGENSIEVIARDSENATSSLVARTVHLTDVIIEQAVMEGNDDVEQHSDLDIAKNGTDLEFGFDDYKQIENQTVGIRFKNIALPFGAKILRAWLQFTAKKDEEEDVEIEIFTDMDVNSAPITYKDGNISARIRAGAASVLWNPEPWIKGDNGTAQRTADISILIQNVIDQSGWNSGQDITIILRSEGNVEGQVRRAYSYNGSSQAAPRLYIEYVSP